MAAALGYLDDAVLYADLRSRLTPLGSLVDLSAAGAEEVATAIDGLDVVLHHPRFNLDRDLLDRETRLRAVLAPGAGYDGIDIAAATERGILVTHQAGCNAEAVAEHAIGMALAVSKRILEGDRLMRSGAPWKTAMFHNHEIGGKTLGIIGLGAIGRQLAHIASAGFGMTVLAFDPYVESPPSGLPVRLVPLDDLLRQSDIVSVNVPLTDDTRRMIGRRELELLPSHAILINTARGHIVDVDAVADALAGGRLAGAGLDVFDDDKLPADHPILSHPAVVTTPHIAGATHESLATQAERQAQAVVRLLAGDVPDTARVLNPSAIERFRRRFSPS
jgi:D-3-phosphoglycerate dehydrogenase